MKILLFISLITWILSPVTLATASTTPFPIPSDSTDNQVGSVKGIVLDAYQKTPLPGVHVVLMNHQTGTITSEAGHFTLESIPFGPQELEISMIGFQTLRLPFQVDAENPKPILQVELTENTLLMEEVVVRPDRKPIARQKPYSMHTLDAQDLQTRTQLGEDVFRSIAQVPGMASNDFSSKFTIRGSDHHEMLVQLDGQELYEPFHIKDVGGGVLGIVDSDLISELALYPGGAPASFDNRLGGVLDMQTSGAAERTRKTMVGLSLTNARFMSQGALAGGKADWLVLGRRGYIDLMLNFTNQDSNFSPRYYDVFGQFRYHLSSSHRLTFNVLQSGDGLHYVETKDPEDKAKSAYYSSYAWVNWRALWSNRLFSTTMLSGASLNSSRNGVDMRMSNGQLVFRAADYRNMDMVTLKQDWTLQSGDDTATTWGFSMKYGQAVYDYYNIERYENDDIDTPFGAQYIQTRADLTPGGTHFGGYVQQQLPIGEKLRMDAGLRFDAVSWTGDRYVSPRISMAYALTPHTRLTGSTGRFFQSQQLHQLDVQDGDSEFHAAEIADQIVLGLSQEINSSLLLKVEAYTKRKDNLRTRYTSLFGDVTSLFPEKGAGRVAVPYSVGRARGIEFSARNPFIRVLDGGPTIPFRRLRTRSTVSGSLKPLTSATPLI